MSWVRTGKVYRALRGWRRYVHEVARLILFGGWSASCTESSVIVPLAPSPETECKHVEAELLTVLDSVQAGALLVSPAGRLRYSNARFGEYLGVEHARLATLETIGELDELLAPRFQRPDGFAQRWKKFAAGGQKSAHDELEMLGPGGRGWDRVAA